MATSSDRRLWTDTLLTAIAPVMWGSTYIVTTQFLPPDRPFTAALLRCLPAGAALVWYGKRMPAPGQWRRMAILAALNIGFFQALLFVAAYRLPGGVAAVVGAIQPLLLMGLAWAVDAQRPARVAVGAALAGAGGMAALLLAPGVQWDAVGIAAALGGTLCMGAGTFLAKRWRTDLPLLAFTGWQLLLGGLMLAPLAWAFDPPLPPLDLPALLGYAYLCVFGAMLSYALWFRGVARLSPAAVSSLGLLSPITAVALGWIVLDQALGGVPLAGLIVVLLSIFTVQRAARAD